MVWGQADRLGLRIGDLIVEIGGFETTESVRTVVTELRLQFAGSENDRESCTLQTHWGELDVLRMI
jgi:C-terminal processing protease CtpA/Prc